MTDETDDQKPKNVPGFRSPKQREAADTEFRRLIGLCGMTNPEAAHYLGISEQGASQKAMGRRPMMGHEAQALVALWAAITNYQQPLDARFPAGARRQQAAYATYHLLIRERKDEYSHLAWSYMGAQTVDQTDIDGNFTTFKLEREITAKRQRKPRTKEV